MAQDPLGPDANTNAEERQLRLFVLRAPVAVALFDSKMRYLSASRRWLWDYQLGPAEDVLGRSHYALLPGIPEHWKRLYDEAVAGRIVHIHEDRFEREDGAARWFRWQAYPWPRSDDGRGSVMVFSEDLTETCYAREELRRSQDRYRALFLGCPDAILVSSEARVALINPECARLFGDGSEHRLLGKSICELFEPGSRAKVRSIVETQGFGPDIDSTVEARIVRLDGQTRDVELYGPFGNIGGGEELRLVLRDISERKRLERQIIASRESERERIGREIHDGIGQQLTALGLLAHKLERQGETEHRLKTVDVVHQLADGIRRTLGDARRLSHGLIPMELDSAGDLPTALADLAADIGRSSNVNCTFSRQGHGGGLHDTMAFDLYRIAQEATNNAVKHAHADAIEISLACFDGRSYLTVRDDGIGLTLPVTRNSGLGLRTMRYRAARIGATLSITSTPGGGTRVRCAWPADEQSQTSPATPHPPQTGRAAVT